MTRLAFFLLLLAALSYVGANWNTATPHERAVVDCARKLPNLYPWQAKATCEAVVTQQEAKP